MKKTRKNSVSVGIAAYNEQFNIQPLILSILKQKLNNLYLDQVIIATDACTDETVLRIKEVKDKRVFLIEGKIRKGKSGRVNEILDKSRADFLVLFDADIKLQHSQVIEQLIEPMICDNSVALTSGRLIPIKGETFSQKVIYTGQIIWDKVRLATNGSGLYYCAGAVRALHKDFYKQLQFPDIRAEDIYPYLVAKQKGLRFVYVPKAGIYFGLAGTFSDYFKQTRRYLQSFYEHQQIFGNEIFFDEPVISAGDKLKVLTREFFHNPFLVSCYVLLLSYPKLTAPFYRKQKTKYWETIQSSKLGTVH